VPIGKTILPVLSIAFGQARKTQYLALELVAAAPASIHPAWELVRCRGATKPLGRPPINPVRHTKAACEVANTYADVAIPSSDTVREGAINQFNITRWCLPAKRFTNRLIDEVPQFSRESPN
jgi:hypothetical protein